MLIDVKNCFAEKNCFTTFADLIKPIGVIMPDGVTGNTSGFGPEESRFEP